MKTKMTVVVDNIAGNNLKGEWGLAILVEYGDKKILVDSGASSLFAKNMEKMGLDIKDVDYAILSHAHYDHSDCMPAFFKNNTKAKFYLRETSGEDCYSKKLFFHVYIGILKNVMSKYSDRIEIVSGDYKLTDGVYLIPHKTANLDKIGEREKMYRKTDKGWVADDFSHEQSLVLDTDKGLVIINSCSHGGAVNIINEIRQTFPDKHVYGLIGGFHLFNKTEQEVNEVAKNIKDTEIEYVCTGHCTGDKAYQILKEQLGDHLQQLHTGLEIVISQ